MRIAIGAAIIQEGRLLLVKKKESWILPGGKPETGESDLACLCREVAEELSGTRLRVTRYFGEFYGRSPHTRDLIQVRVYFADLESELGLPGQEIGDSAWVADPCDYTLSKITSQIFRSLQRFGYLL